ncbi:Zinc finger protein hangover [Frankliniella fusca]|uniref:Zinc finger protein hangover n=1 Tax=Frankliniella fusca TaxID=407009 RepID=A0AAE1GV45_9NEOP|nr:Zinc finger protein hangover [Frankliniella fusca]
MLGRFSVHQSLPLDVSETPAAKLKNLCRMCAGVCSKPVSLYGPEGVANELAVKFSSYLPIKVAETDTLPLQLCYDCTNLLIQWDAAVLVAIASDKKLRALQWREQFEKKRTEDAKSSNEPAKTGRVSISVPEESLSCSVCPKSGMVFRELIEHLKSHEIPQSLSSDNSRTNPNIQQSVSYSSATILPEVGDLVADPNINPELLEPIICLEAFSPQKKSYFQRRTNESDQSPRDTNNEKLPVRSKRKSSGKLDERSGKLYESSSENSEGGSEDGVVTSSTSGGHSVLQKPGESTEGDTIPPASSPTNSSTIQKSNLKSAQKESDSAPFKPKVRIISAESINQSLEERAKANQTAKSSASQMSASAVASPASMQSVLKPLTSALTSNSHKAIILPGGVFRVDGVKNPTKIVKLADGRYVRLYQTSVPLKSGSGRVICSSTPVQRRIHTAVYSKLEKSPTSANQSPGKDTSPPSQISPPVNVVSFPIPIAPAPSSSEKKSSSDEFAGSNKTVTLGNAKIITFNHQPGPRQMVSRYVCAYCGKRNLPQDSLEEHARSHSKDPVDNVTFSDKSN